MLNQLKRHTITGILFVLILGTLSHFFYGWSNNNFFIGLFSPVNESTWEHMKLLFFPMLLFSLITIPKLKQDYPCITSALLAGILVGTVFIPIIFYTYTGIVGYDIFILDLFTFLLAVVIAFYTAYKFTLSCKMQDYVAILRVIVYVFLICFLLFTYSPPSIGLFAVPL